MTDTAPDIIEAFLAELDAHPKSRAKGLAYPEDRAWELDNLRRRLVALHREGDEDARAIDLFDRARVLMRRQRKSMHRRLVGLKAIFRERWGDSLAPPSERPASRAASALTTLQ